eukprot:841837-Prorocentrum_minimum.AAC.4
MDRQLAGASPRAPGGGAGQRLRTVSRQVRRLGPQVAEPVSAYGPPAGRCVASGPGWRSRSAPTDRQVAGASPQRAPGGGDGQRLRTARWQVRRLGEPKVAEPP